MATLRNFLSQDLLDSLCQFGSATIHEAQGQTGALNSAIKPIDPVLKLAGRALTVDARPGDNLVIHYALSKAQPGDVLVVDAKAFVDAGPWGDILTLAAQKAGIAGLVIDGAVRDAEAIIEMGFPVFSRGLSIKGTNKYQPGRVNVPVVCGGVLVNPGDIVVGDRDGVVAIPADRLDAVMAASKQRVAAEDDYRDQINAGRSTIELLKLSDILARHEMR
ncbi:4-carboxy-4-hydroxy-2-oxoadipate aldolase/oxaloacetate decarboxylase [Paracoccus aminophilus]|nr:4-carboxy-4-hydroxy-2-oxoadipate aldolase/oxaloacetate decarboxylase [Paracoccus aminophilus]